MFVRRKQVVLAKKNCDELHKTANFARYENGAIHKETTCATLANALEMS